VGAPGGAIPCAAAMIDYGTPTAKVRAESEDKGMRRRLAIFSVIGATLAALAVGGIGVLSASAQNEPQVTLCHATGAVNNPYVTITVDQSAVFNNGIVPNGHGTHTGPIFPDMAQGPGNSTFWGDIIPAFGAYPGLNVPAGQAILDNDCEIPGPPPTTGPPVTTAPPTTAPSTTAPSTTAPKAPPTTAPAAAPSAPSAVVVVPRVTG
jgi:hypothetical protein